MKYEEAITEFQRDNLKLQRSGVFMEENINIRIREKAERNNLAIEALEKQIPKKAEANHHCPSCGCGLPHEGITSEMCNCCFDPLYCPYCGQAIDWNEDDYDVYDVDSDFY